MRRSELTVGRDYLASDSFGKPIHVRLDAIRWTQMRLPGACSNRRPVNGCVFDVTDLGTGRKLTFRSATRFRKAVQ